MWRRCVCWLCCGQTRGREVRDLRLCRTEGVCWRKCNGGKKEIREEVKERWLSKGEDEGVIVC